MKNDKNSENLEMRSWLAYQFFLFQEEEEKLESLWLIADGYEMVFCECICVYIWKQLITLRPGGTGLCA